MRYRFRRSTDRNAPIRRAWRRVFLLIAAFLLVLNIRSAPLMKTVIRQQAEQSAAEVLSETVLSLLAEQEQASFLSVVRGASGEIRSVETDVQAVNRFQAEMTDRLQKALKKTELHRCGIPLGTLFGGVLLRERGPKVSVLFRLASSVSCTVESAFSSAGINQTMHSVRLRVKANAYVLIPGEKEPICSEGVYPVAEEVIVGNVPQVSLTR